MITMTRRRKSIPPLRIFFTVAAATILFLGVSILFAAARPDEPLPADTIGSIEGEAIAVSGPMSIEVVRGQVKTVLRSGSDIRVKAGTARIDLVEGGQITICGPAHLSVLKSGIALTVALDTGTIHARIEHQPTLTIYTPQIQARSIPIGDEPQDLLAGFDAAGAMCIRTVRGAVRLEQQLTGQNLIIPQNGDILVTNGQLDTLRSSAGRCACELRDSSAPPPEISRLATAEEVRNKASDPKSNAPGATPEKPTAHEEPIYKVLMPPLTYDANSKVPPEFDPKFIVLIRRVRVRPTLIFQGRVEGEAVAAATPTQPIRQPPPTTVPAPAKAAPNEGFVNRVKSFFHNLWSSS
jgi:hypothetical protein